MATHSSVLVWRIPGMGEPGGLLSMGSHRVWHNWSDLAEAASSLNIMVFLKLIYFNWRLITLHYYSGFCHTLTWISHRCTCVPHPDPPSQLPPHPIPQGYPSAPALSTLSHASNLDWRSISHMVIYMLASLVAQRLKLLPAMQETWVIYVSMLFSQIIPPSPSTIESKSLFFTSVSLLLSRIRVIITIFLNSIYMH